MKNVKSLKVVEEATIPKAERKRRKNLKKKMKTDHRFLFLLIALGIITLATAVKLTKPSAKKAAAKKAALKEKKETPLVKKLSEKEVARITKETKAALATLVSLPDPPFTNILSWLIRVQFYPLILANRQSLNKIQYKTFSLNTNFFGRGQTKLIRGQTK